VVKWFMPQELHHASLVVASTNHLSAEATSKSGETKPAYETN